MFTTEEKKVIDDAIAIINRRFYIEKPIFESSEHAVNFLKVKIGHYQNEVFHVTFLDGQHKLIADEIMFMGTISSTAVYPRVIAQKALEYNARSVILAHNHPSGTSEPSDDDITITEEISLVLGLIDVVVLDHVIVGEKCSTFQDLGLL